MASEGVEEPGTAQGRPADTDTLGLRAARRRTVAWCVGLAAALVVVTVVNQVVRSRRRAAGLAL